LGASRPFIKGGLQTLDEVPTMKRLRVYWERDMYEQNDSPLGLLLSSPGAHPIFYVGGPHVVEDNEAHDLIASEEGYREILETSKQYGIAVEYIGEISTLEALDEVGRYEDETTS
jgi:hypothetical protein